MKDYRKLRMDEVTGYAHMIPAWLMEEALEDDTIEIWGVEEFGEACGTAVIMREIDAVTLMHLYVVEEYRNCGIGSGFLLELMLYSYGLGVSQFQVKYMEEQFPELERLLRSYPMRKNDDEQIGTAVCKLGYLQGLKNLQGGYGQVKALSACTTESLACFYQKIISRGMDLVDFPLKKGEYLEDYSAVTMEDGEPAGLLLVKKTEDGVSIPFMINLSENVAAPIEMIRFAIQKGSQDFPSDTMCYFAIINETLYMLLEKLGIVLNKRKCVSLDLSYFEEYERNATAYIDYIQTIASLQ